MLFYALKFTVIESTELEDPSDRALLRQIDWRCECLRERLKLVQSSNEWMEISEELIAALIHSYEVRHICSVMLESICISWNEGRIGAAQQ
uniref:Uncharacterized protein n=1 Tax=Gongylonema pulchrum TaxID=637853 RepID=A0A183DU97_9BILA